jgi:hypothetical protein
MKEIEKSGPAGDVARLVMNYVSIMRNSMKLSIRYSLFYVNKFNFGHASYE